MPVPGSILDAAADDAKYDRLEKGEAREDDIKVPHHQALMREGWRAYDQEYVFDMVFIGRRSIIRLCLRENAEDVIGKLFNSLLQDDTAFIY